MSKKERVTITLCSDMLARLRQKAADNSRSSLSDQFDYELRQQNVHRYVAKPKGTPPPLHPTAPVQVFSPQYAPPAVSDDDDEVAE